MKLVDIFYTFIYISACLMVEMNTRKSDTNSLITYSPKKGWINDPNGLIYVERTYHLFYQYCSECDLPARIGWGHAVSSDLVDWQELDVALPYNAATKEQRFSGSAVYDRNNSSGLAVDGGGLIVSVYTSYYGENSTLADGSPVASGTQCQSIAYSQDTGQTWHTYQANPVIRYPPPQYALEYNNFRDPKVFWYQPQSKWVMVTVLSRLRKAIFYSSTNLKDWIYMSEFGSNKVPANAVWECPDLYQMNVLEQNESKWVLSISLVLHDGVDDSDNMRYFVGDFDGTTFIVDNINAAATTHIDHGSDFYAGVTWNNAGDERLLIGWVNNWKYATKITQKYRGGLSLVRELYLKKEGRGYKLIQRPAKAIYNYVKEKSYYSNKGIEEGIRILENNVYNFIITIKGIDKTGFSLVIEDEQKNKEAEISYEAEDKVIYVRKKNIDPAEIEKFVQHSAKLDVDLSTLSIFIDNKTLTIFCNDGEIVFTELLISNSEIRKLRLVEGFNAKVDVVRNLLAKQ